VAVHFNDFTEAKRAEVELRASESRLSAILNTAADAIITIDIHGAIQSVNAAAERIFGYSAAELLGQNVKMLMPPPYQEEQRSVSVEIFATGDKRMIGIGREAEGRRKDGTTVSVDLAVSEMKKPEALHRHHPRHRPRKELEREVVEIASLEQRRNRPGFARYRGPRTHGPEHPSGRPGRNSADGSLGRAKDRRANGRGLRAVSASFGP